MDAATAEEHASALIVLGASIAALTLAAVTAVTHEIDCEVRATVQAELDDE